MKFEVEKNQVLDPSTSTPMKLKNGAESAEEASGNEIALKKKKKKHEASSEDGITLYRRL